VLRVSASVYHILGRFAPDADLHDLLGVGMVLAKVRAQAALTVIDLLHVNSFLVGGNAARAGAYTAALRISRASAAIQTCPVKGRSLPE
jgi:hypothetical protein